MSTHQVSYPRAAKKSITEESDRPGTCRSKVGCEAMDDPCTNKMRPEGPEGSPACLFHRNNFTAPSLVVQCSVPEMQSGLFMLLQSPLMLFALMIFAHLSISDRTWAPNSSGVIAIATAPCFSQASFT